MTVYNTFNYSYMERVQTWVNSPYIGTFQYKNAGPKRIHKKNLPPFIIPLPAALNKISSTGNEAASAPK